MSKTMDLANAYSTLGDNLDDLFVSLESQGQSNLAQQVKNAENAIEQAALDLNALDAVDTLQRPADQQTLQELTDGMNAWATAIRVQETRVASVCQLCASLVLVVTHFKSGDPLGAVAAARNAVAQFASLTG
jgi:hypothetical protein